MVEVGLVVCARVDHPDDVVIIKPGGEHHTCADCGVAIWVSPSTMAMKAMGVELILVCNPCGKAMVAALRSNGRLLDYAIAPGALGDPTPDDRRRRNELEARGFRQLSEEDLPRG